MGPREWWMLANVATVLLTGAVCVLLFIRIDDARHKLDIPGQWEDARAWLRYDIRYLWSKIAVNLGVCLLGLIMLGIALEWSGRVYHFVPTGTAGFAAIWAANAYVEFRSYWDLHDVAELSARLAGERAVAEAREEGC